MKPKRKLLISSLFLATALAATAYFTIKNNLEHRRYEEANPVKQYEIFNEQVHELKLIREAREDFNNDGIDDYMTRAYDFNNNGIADVYAEFRISTPIPGMIEFIHTNAELVTIDANEDGHIDHLLFDSNGDKSLDKIVRPQERVPIRKEEQKRPTYQV